MPVQLNKLQKVVKSLTNLKTLKKPIKKRLETTQKVTRKSAQPS